MPANRTPGMDNGYYDWSPLPLRRPLRWPDDAPVALCVVVNLERYELSPPQDASMPAGPLGSAAGTPYPDIYTATELEYGNRVGIFRVMKVLDQYQIRATVAMDAGVAQHYPFLVGECQRRGWEFVGHGLAVNNSITSNMTESQEREYIRTTLEAINKSTGKWPAGWFGPQWRESPRTPALLAEAGVKYVMDWPNDEQPYRMTVPRGQMVSLPVLLELDDDYAYRHRGVTPWRWERMAKEAFDTLYDEGAATGRLLTLSLHPWIIGQPHRIKSLDVALNWVCTHERVWKATGEEIVDWYLRVEGAR